MLETGNDSGVFTGEVQLCGDLNVSEGDKVYVLYGNIGDAASIESTTPSCGPDEVIVNGVCVNAFSGEPSGSTISVETDRSSYNDGDTVKITGSISDLNENYNVVVSILVIDPVGNIVSISQVLPSSDGSFSHSIT